MHTADGRVQSESVKNTSFLALPLFNLLAARGLKGVCQAAWPDITRLNHKQFIPGTAWEYCLWRSTTGIEQTLQVPSTEQWANVAATATSTDCPEVPIALLTQPYLLMLFLIIAPYR